MFGELILPSLYVVHYGQRCLFACYIGRNIMKDLSLAQCYDVIVLMNYNLVDVISMVAYLQEPENFEWFESTGCHELI